MNIVELVLFSMLALMPAVHSFDLLEKPFNTLPNVEPLAGVHMLSAEEHTPPSMQTTTWWFLVKRNSDDAAKIGNSCPDNAIVCAETVVIVDDDKNKNPTVSQLISFTKEDTTVAYDEKSQLVTKSKTQWGDREVNLEVLLLCDLDAKDDVIQWNAHEGHTFTDSMSLNWTNAAFCSLEDLKNGGRSPDKDHKDNDDSLGWFTTLFLFSLVVFAGYLVGQAWLNTSTMGSSSDFLNELFDVIVENLSNIPRFIGEIVSKITGSGNRGGYSAV